MIAWNVNVNGRAYSRVYTDRGASAQQALDKWESEIAFSSGEECLNAIKGLGDVTTTRYIKSRLDSYGTKRGG
jgi:hypothetical protein